MRAARRLARSNWMPQLLREHKYNCEDWLDVAVPSSEGLCHKDAVLSYMTMTTMMMMSLRRYMYERGFSIFVRSGAVLLWTQCGPRLFLYMYYEVNNRQALLQG